jgi:putative ABC transport system permease protein
MRLFLSRTAVACGVALVCAIDLVNHAVTQAFIEVIDTMAGRAALQVTAVGGGFFPERTLEAIAGLPGIELAVPVLSASAFTTDGSGAVVSVHGVDLTHDAAVRIYERAGAAARELDDPLAFLAQPDSLMVPASFAARHGLARGDAIMLDTPHGRRRFVVRDLLEPTGIARVQGGNLAVMDIQAAQLAFGQPGAINRIDVVVARDADRDRVADAMTAILPAGLRVEAPAQRKIDLHQLMRSPQLLTRGMSLLGLLAAFLIAFSTLASVFERRTWEHAVIRAVGVSRRSVWWELTKESLLIAGPAIVFGIPLGIVLGHALLPLIAQATALSVKLIAAEGTLALSPTAIVLAIALGVGTVALAAALPASRAAQVEVSATLARRGTEQPADVRARALVSRGAPLALGLLALAHHLLTHSAASGLAATALFVVALAIATRPLLTLVGEPLRRVMARVGGPSGRLAMATLLANPRRSALAIAMLCVGFGSVLWLWTLARSFERSVLELLPGKLRGDLSVTSANVNGYVEAPIDDAILPRLATVPGVAIAVGEQVAEWQYGGGPVAIDAFDPAYFTDDRFGEWALVGRRLPGLRAAVARGEAAIVSENLTRNLGVAVGDVLTLTTPGGPLSLKVAGVVTEFLSPRGTINVSRDLYERYWHDREIVRGLVAVAPGTDALAVEDAITRTLGTQYHLRVLTIGALMDWFASQVRQAFAALHVLAGLVLVVVAAGVSDAIAAGTIDRTREFGLARAIGARPAAVQRTVLIEALVMGALGLVLAMLLGTALGLLWAKVTFPALLGWTIHFHLPLRETVLVAATTLAVPLLAAYLPARRAARLDPVVALRTE